MPAPRPTTPLAPLLRLLLAGAYPVLAHAASLRGDGALAALAFGDIALILLLEPLLQRRAAAWIALPAIAAGLAWLAQSPHALLPLLLVPVLFIGLVAWFFGRTLRVGSTPLISRIVAALEGVPPAQLAPELRVYTRRLTSAWAWLLGLLAMANLVLALIAVPNGLLAGIGIAPPLQVSEVQWSWFANGLNYGIIAGFFLLEYHYRKRHFPGRYRNVADFVQRMARLGPAFWSTLFR